MRIISEPRLQRLKANNKLKATRLKRKAHLARVSRKKKAEKLDGMRAENESLRQEIDRLEQQNHIFEQQIQRMESHENERHQQRQESPVKMECIRTTLVQKPQWMLNIGEMQQRLTMDEDQIARCNKEVVPNINMIEQNISNSKAYIDRLKSNNEEKLMLQQQIHDALTQILTKEQMSRLIGTQPEQ